MRRTRIDDRTADRLFSGTVTSDDAPPGYAGVADLLHTARPVPAAGGMAREAVTVASMSSVISRHPISLSSSRRNTMLSKILTAKVAAVAAVAFIGVGAGTAAAATGSLPGAAQSTASAMLAKVGISVPSPDTHSNGHADTRGKSGSHTSKPTSRDATTDANADTTTGPNAHADFGLCTAANAANGHPNTNASVFPSSTTCSTVVHPGQGSGKPADPGSQGKANKPADPGTQELANKPADPGSQGKANKPADPGSQGLANRPADPGSQGLANKPADPGSPSSTGSSAAANGLSTAGNTPAAGHIPAGVHGRP